MSSDFHFICNLIVFVFYWFDYEWIKKNSWKRHLCEKNSRVWNSFEKRNLWKIFKIFHAICVEWGKRSVRVRVFVEVKLWRLSVFLSLNHFVAIGFYYRVVCHLICGILNFFVTFQLYEGISFMKCLSKLLLWIFIRCIKY